MRDPTILVPLDGSPLAEAVLPYARALATAMNARITFAVVWENIEETLLREQPDLAARVAVSGQETCRRYADEQVQKLAGSGIQTDVRVIEGKPSERILQLADDIPARCIALGSHGRSGIGRWWYGSVAGSIIRHATTPVLVVGPEVLQAPKPAPEFRRILVPLDGSEVAERALALAAELAPKTDATISLAQVLRWSTQAFLFGVPDVDAARVDEELTKASNEYLERMKGNLAVPTDAHVLHGFPAEELLKLVQSERIDLIVMGTHGRGALMRVALGSVAERMVHAKAPVLLVREGATQPSD